MKVQIQIFRIYYLVVVEILKIDFLVFRWGGHILAVATCLPITLARVYFIIGYYLRLKRAIITFILYKEGKVNYLFLGSYRPIALENTLSKILERVIADYIVDIAKEYALLL
jgi:hypothetical protein